MEANKKAAPGANRAALDTASHSQNRNPPTVTGQCAQVLGLIRQHQPVLSFTLTADNAIPETAARVHDLRAMGFNIQTTIHSAVEFRGVKRRNVASYSLGSPEWPSPGFFDDCSVDHQAERQLPQCSEPLKSWAPFIATLADGMAAAIPDVSETEKPERRRAILRNWKAVLEISRQSLPSGGA